MTETIELAKLAALLALFAALVAIALYDLLYVWPLVRRVAALERDCQALGDGSAPRAAADPETSIQLAGVEARVREQLTQLEERLAQVELAGQGAAYERAIGLAEQGEDAERLIPLLGLSEGEADLVRLLHGGRASVS